MFIPVIPLKRKRVIDDCSLCRMHFAVDHAKYERSRQQAISDALARFRDAPSPESGLAAHATILAFHDPERAAGLRQEAIAKFPNDLKLLRGLASHLEEVSATDEAVPLHEACLRLQPDSPSARVGVAAKRMAEGRIEDARSLLAFLEAPGAGRKYSLEPLRMIAGYYQKDGRHPEALRISSTLLRENPALGQDRSFRIFVRKSETAQGSLESILPPQKRSLLGLFGIGNSEGYARWQTRAAWGFTVLLLAAAGLALSNEYFRRNRTIFVVNACGKPVEVQVDDSPPQSFERLGRLSVSEGRHRLKVTGAVQENHDVVLQASYWDRWLKKPVWVLNPGSEAVIRESTMYYAVNPRPPDQRPVTFEPFSFHRHVDFAFEPPPDTLKLETKSSEAARVSLQWEHAADADLFGEIVASDRRAAFAFAERRLRRAPEQDKLLEAYVRAATSADLPQIQAFMKTGLDRRPVVVPWHRAYQSLCEYLGQDADLVALYDRFVKTEPASAQLLYLKGRIELDWDKQDTIYKRAIQLDPRLPWPWMAFGARAEAGAHWDEALRCLTKAHELAIDPELIRSSLQTARLGSGGAQALEPELRQRIAAQPSDVVSVVSLAEALAASGQTDKIDGELNAWQNRALPASSGEVIATVRALGLYFAGKLNECADRCRSVPSLKSGTLHAQSLLALQKSKDVIANASFSNALADPRLALAVSLALALENQPEEAARWRDQAIANLENAPRGVHRAARILAAEGPSPASEFDHLYMDADLKAVMLALMAQRHSARRSEYLASAARFNVRRRPPYHLVRQAIDAVRRHIAENGFGLMRDCGKSLKRRPRSRPQSLSRRALDWVARFRRRNLAISGRCGHPMSVVPARRGNRHAPIHARPSGSKPAMMTRGRRRSAAHRSACRHDQGLW